MTIDYKKVIDNLYTALDVIAEFESGDSIELKRAIRAEIERLEKIDETLENL